MHVPQKTHLQCIQRERIRTRRECERIHIAQRRPPVDALELCERHGRRAAVQTNTAAVVIAAVAKADAAAASSIPRR